MTVDIDEARSLSVDFAIFDGDRLLYRGALLIVDEETELALNEAARPVRVTIRSRFELPACRVEIEVRKQNASDDAPFAYPDSFRAALRMGVHNSDDWESISLGPYDFAFHCTAR